MTAIQLFDLIKEKPIDRYFNIIVVDTDHILLYLTDSTYIDIEYHFNALYIICHLGQASLHYSSTTDDRTKEIQDWFTEVESYYRNKLEKRIISLLK